MQFLNPLVLYGLLALAIPVLIHLFNFKKPRRVYFTNVRFLRELKLESRKRSRLKHWLVLVMRALAFASLIIAFAMPVIRSDRDEAAKGRPLIMVYLDNSYSLQSHGKYGVLFEEAVKRATELAESYAPSDEFYLITNEFSAQNSRVVNRSDYLSMVAATKLSPEGRSTRELFERVAEIRKRNPGRDAVFFMISDFQASTVQLTASEPMPDLETYLIPVRRASMANLFVDSVWMDIPVIRPGQVVDFHVRVGNTGDAVAGEVPLTLAMSGKEVAVGTVTVPANGKAVVTLTARIQSEGNYHGVISVEDNPVIFDDRFYIAAKVTRQRKVLILNGESQESTLNWLFEGDSLFMFESRKATQIDYASLGRYDIIYCNGIREITSGMKDALTGYVEGGGVMAVIPASGVREPQPVNVLLEGMGLAVYGPKDTADVRISAINFDHPLYKGVYSKKPSNLSMPMIRQHYPIVSHGGAGELWIMKLMNDQPLMMSGIYGRGRVYLFATGLDPESSNLAAHAELFVPLVYNMALFSGTVMPLYYTLGIDRSVAVAWAGEAEESAFRIKNLQGGPEFIPGHRNEPFGALLFFEDQIAAPGNYGVIAAETEIGPLAFNFNHFESDLRFDDEDRIQSWISEQGYTRIRIISAAGRSISGKLEEMQAGKRLWHLFVVAALAFLLAEVLLLRLWGNREPKTTL